MNALEGVSALEGKRVVIADDDRIIRDLLSLRCSQLGLAVDAVGDGASTVAAVSRDRPHLLILDLNLPDLDGFAVLERIATTAPAPPVILLTGSSDATTQQRCRDMNVAHVYKDTDSWNNLEPLIRQMLGQPSVPHA